MFGKWLSGKKRPHSHSGMALPDALLGKALRGRPGGFAFERRSLDGGTTAGSYCEQARLLVAVEQHPDHPALAADPQLAAGGIEVMRVNRDEVLADLGAVVRQVVAECQRRTGG